jgi:NAD(P)-dependent dehydrogenase (short-subunit alcohol dehydrogenase family)
MSPTGPRPVVVTGSDSGIGRATAVALAGAGHPVGITWNSDEAGAGDAAAEVRRNGGTAEVARLDLTEQGTIGETVKELAGRLGGLGAFVNNSGTGAAIPFLDMELDDWQEVIDVDLTGAFLAAQAAARLMVEAGEGGRIVNVTSVHEHLPKKDASAYCAAKGGLGLLTKVMAVELAPHGITVNSVAPGEIATGMTGHEDEDPHRIEREAIALGRPGHADEIAATVAHLVSPGASYTTGASIVVDGGLSLMGPVLNQ